MKRCFYLGQECLIIHKGGRGLNVLNRINSQSYELYIVGNKEYMMRRIKDFYKKQAQIIITPMVIKYCEILSVKYNRLSFKDTKTRWGSASSTKNLSFNWRVIMAPIEIIEYVAAHETAHLLEMNHKKSFWRLCEKLCSNSLEKHKWLKENGHNFMRVNFEE